MTTTETSREWWGQDVIPRIRWRIIVPNECESPDGYGTAWQLWQTNARVCMPLPINLIAGAIRATYHWFRRGFYASGHSPRYADAMAWGEVRGYAYGFDHGTQHGIDLSERTARERIAPRPQITPATLDDLKRVQQKHRGGR